jgi:hypothetical protein
MKAILEFDLPDDEYEFRHAVSGVKYHHAIGDLREEIRSKLKWSDDQKELEYYERLEKIFDEHFGDIYQPD